MPHGESVSLTAPAAFRFTFPTDPGKHLRAADILDPRAQQATTDDRERLPAALTSLMQDIGIPNGLSGVGYGRSDIGALVEGTMQQQRLLAVAPRTVREEDVEAVLTESLENW